VCWKPRSSCWSFHLLREEFLSAPIHSPLSGSPYRSFSGSRRDDGELTANSKACSRGGGEDLGRWTATGGANLAASPRRSGARQQEQATPTSPLPRDGTTGELDGDGRTAAERSSSGGATRVHVTAAVALGVRACGEGGAAGQRRRLK
jgi:hypothetical protein